MLQTFSLALLGAATTSSHQIFPSTYLGTKDSVKVTAQRSYFPRLAQGPQLALNQVGHSHPSNTPRPRSTTEDYAKTGDPRLTIAVKCILAFFDRKHPIFHIKP